MEKLTRIFSAYPELTQVILFGSRATGKASARSDIDLATRGIVDDSRLGRLALDLADLDIPQICDLRAYEHIVYAPLKRAHRPLRDYNLREAGQRGDMTGGICHERRIVQEVLAQTLADSGQ